MENLFNTAIYIYIIAQLIFIHQAIHAYYKYSPYIKESTFEILSMEDVIPIFSIWNIPLMIGIAGLIVEAKASNNSTTILILVLVAITIITHYSRKYYVVVYETIKQIDTKTIPSPTPLKIALGVPCFIGLALSTYMLSNPTNTLLSALIVFSFSSVITAILIELFYPLYSRKKKNRNSSSIFKKINFRWQPFVAVPLLIATIIFGADQLAGIQCINAIEAGATKSINFYCGVVSNLNLAGNDVSLWIVTQLSTNIWLYGVLTFIGFLLFYWNDEEPIGQENHSSTNNEKTNSKKEKSNEEYGFKSSRFRDDKERKKYEKWSNMANDPNASQNEREFCMRRMIEFDGKD